LCCLVLLCVVLSCLALCCVVLSCFLLSISAGLPRSVLQNSLSIERPEESTVIVRQSKATQSKFSTRQDK
jgi:hypothetical protein